MMRIALAALALALSTAAAAGPAPKTVRWLMAHDREDSPFQKLMDGFASRIEKGSGGALKIEYVHIKGPDSQWGQIGRQSVIAGEAELSQLASGSLHPEEGAGLLDLPFLFRGYEHAEAFFESAGGKRLLADAHAASEGKLRALAFTYSGGFRVLAGTKPVEKPEDLKGARMNATRGGPVMSGLEKAWGAASVEGGKTEEDFAAGRIDLDETEVNRYAIARRKKPEAFQALDVLNLTNHRMYTTAIIVNEAFLASLPKEQQKLLQDEIVRLARDERRTSIQLERENLAKLKKEGVKVHDMTAAARREFAKSGDPVLAAFPGFAAQVAEIRGLKDLPIKGLAAR